MRTPKEYTENLKRGIITEAMLQDCLFSVNKRAKNYRDKEREYRNRYRSNYYYRHDIYNNEERYRTKKNEYYAQKDLLLTILSPVCIHKELIGYERKRIYDYEKEYSRHVNPPHLNC